jgi:transposase
MDTNTRLTVSHTNGHRNRRHPIEFKRAVVEQSYLPGSSVARLARDHGINANQIFAWRKLYRDAGLTLASMNTTVLLPVNVAESVSDDAVPAIKSETHLAGAGTMELAIGNARLTICGSPDAGSLRTVLAHLLR